jgi:NAD(P)-dependent dehydrogenase (short-subunit alcohol dehydrogenase family)
MSADTWAPPDLAAAVAVVTGASRGVGRGIATALGAAGATVYVTGRSSGADRTEDLPGTVEDTAAAVTAAGGKGVPVVCDHTSDTDVDALFATVTRDHGRLDLLVNNAWSGYERWTDARFDAPFWDQPRWRYDLFAGSLRGWYTASQLAARTMVPARRGLLVGVSYLDGEVYLGQAAYDTVKRAATILSANMARDLRRHGVTSLCVLPGFVRTERVEAAATALGDGPAAVLHSPEYVGRAIAALLADSDLLGWTGQTLAVGDLAAHYGFTDTDGRRPPAFRIEGRISLATRMDRLFRLGAPARAAQPTSSGGDPA